MNLGIGEIFSEKIFFKLFLRFSQETTLFLGDAWVGYSLENFALVAGDGVERAEGYETNQLSQFPTNWVEGALFQ